MTKGVPARRALDLTKPFVARGAEATFVTALNDSQFVFDLTPTGRRKGEKKKTVIVDKMGCDYNGGQRTVWNSDLDAPRFKEGDTVFALRIAEPDRMILKGDVKGVEGKSFYLIRVPFEKNSEREDGLFKVAFAVTLGSLDEVRAKVNALVESLQRLDAFTAVKAPAVVEEKAPAPVAASALKKGWLQEAVETHTRRTADKEQRRAVTRRISN